MDLNKVSLVMGLKIEGFNIGHTSLKTDSSKVFKHEKVCSHNQYIFIPFVFDNIDFVAPETNKFLERVQNSCITISCPVKQ